MKIHIICESKLSEVALRSRSKPIPHRIWIALGEIPLVDSDDDLDEFELSPIYEHNPDTGKSELSDRYFIGSFSTDHMRTILESHEVIHLTDFPQGGEAAWDFVKKLHDIFKQLGHDVLLIETIDY